MAQGVVERFIPLDMSDADTVFNRCLAAVRRVQQASRATGWPQREGHSMAAVVVVILSSTCSAAMHPLQLAGRLLTLMLS